MPAKKLEGEEQPNQVGEKQAVGWRDQAATYFLRCIKFWKTNFQVKIWNFTSVPLV